MKNVAYAVLLLTSFALGCFGAFMVYHGFGMPTHDGRVDEQRLRHRADVAWSAPVSGSSTPVPTPSLTRNEVPMPSYRHVCVVLLTFLEFIAFGIYLIQVAASRCPIHQTGPPGPRSALGFILMVVGAVCLRSRAPSSSNLFRH